MTVTEMVNDHSEVGPSSLKSIMLCPGRVRMQRGLDEVQSFAAAEGSVAHQMCEDILNGKEPYKKGSVLNWNGHKIEVDQEMVDAVNEYINYIYTIKADYAADFFDEFVEGKVRIPEYPEVFGTVDYCLSVPFKVLYVVDFKYGKGIVVDPRENPQGMAYALGAAGDMLDTYEQIIITIVQPRAQGETVKEWFTSSINLKVWRDTILADTIEQALKEDSPLNPGEEQCRWCRAKDICPALAEQSLELAQSDFAEYSDFNPVNPDTFTIQQLEEIYPKIGMLKTWIKGIEARVFNEMATGGKVEGYKLVKGRRSRSWVDPDKAVEFLTHQLGSEAFEKKPLSPAKAEKKLDKDTRKELKNFIHVSEGKPVIVKNDDKRKAISMADEDFKNVNYA